MNDPYHKTERLEYVDANTGQVLHVEMMRRFYEWHSKKRQYVMVREYQLKYEAQINPGMVGKA